MRILTSGKSAPAIFVLSWTLRIALVLFTQAYRSPVNPVETVLVAKSLAAGQGFSNPYGCVTGATAHLAPVYPFILSIIYRLFPSGSSGEFASYVFSATVISLAYALLPWLAIKLRLDPRIGANAGFIGAAVPLFFWVEVESDWEAPLSTLLLTVALGKTSELFEGVTIRRAVGIGLLWGVVLLTAPTFLLVFAGFILVWMWQGRRNPMGVLRAGAALCLAAFLLITPWTIRNYLRFHEFILIRGNAGMQLHMSFNPLARATCDEGDISGAFLDQPHTTQRACLEYVRFGEVAMNERYQRQAVEWIRANPRRTVDLVGEHFMAFWLMEVPSPIKTVASEALTFFALMGFWVCFRKHRFAFLMLAIILLTYPLIYYVSVFDPRYRYPLHPITLLLASVFFTAMAQKFWRRPGAASVF